MNRKEFKEISVNLFWPEVCPFCEEISKTGICGECKSELEKLIVAAPKCMKCSKPISDDNEEFCVDCTANFRSFDKGYSFWIHGDIVSKSIYKFKYENKRRYGKLFVNALPRKLEYELKSVNAQVLIPVQLCKKRKRTRGYNQSLILANELSERLRIPVLDCVIRTKETSPQKELSKSKRRDNINKAFCVLDINKRIKRVIIIDDIFTTGSTVNEIAKVLKERG
ncbi:MAG: double zinc ribbon domain-containing protein, partial [Suipraeoptans sp.]